MSKRKYSVMAETDELYMALTCSICLEFFNHPKQLPNCSHTFCADCLESLRVTSNNDVFLECPNCRTRSFTPQGVKAFQTNIVAQQLVEKLTVEKLAEERSQNAASQTGVDKCSHVFDASRSNCDHCQQRFCERCKTAHLNNLRVKILDMAKNLSDRQSSIDVTAYSEKLRAETEKVRLEFYGHMDVIEIILKTERDRFNTELDSIVTHEVGKLQASLSGSFVIQRLLAELQSSEEPNLAASELAKMHEELLEREKTIETVQKKVDGVSSSSFVLDWDTSFMAQFGTWKIATAARKSPSSIRNAKPVTASSSLVEISTPGSNLEKDELDPETSTVLYKEMSVGAVGASKDAFSSNVRLPRQVCALDPCRVAVIHEINRISIYQWNGRIVSTLKIFDPRNKAKTDLFLQNLAYDTDGVLYMVDDAGTIIVCISLNSSANRMPECVVPNIFALKAMHDFHGLAVCSAKEELYTGEGAAICIYNTKDQLKVRTLPVDCVPHVHGCIGDASCQIFFSPASGDCLRVMDRNSTTVTAIANKGNQLGQVNQVTGICFDGKGNFLIADSKNCRIQVFSLSSSKPLTYFSNSEPLPDSQTPPSRLKPFGVATVWSASKDSMRVAVPDYGAHKVYFFESKKTVTTL